MRNTLLAAALVPFLAHTLFAQDNKLPPPVRIDSGVSGHIHPSLCVSKKGTLVAIYCKSEYQPCLISRSTDGGKTWSKPALFGPTRKTDIYPGSLTTLADGRLVHAWNVWFSPAPKMKSRYVAYSISSDDGLTWSAPKSLAKNKDEKIESVIRHPLVELSPRAWLFPLADRTIVYDPETGVETPFGDGSKHGLVPIVRTPRGTFISGKGLRSMDDGKTWQAVKPFPDVSSQGWRQQLVALKNGWLLASQSIGKGVGGDKIHFIISRDDGLTWDFQRPVEFYNPGRPIGGRACPRSVDVDDHTVGTIFYDIDPKQPGGSGVFFRAMPTSRLATHPDADKLRQIARVAASVNILTDDETAKIKALINGLTDEQVRKDAASLLPDLRVATAQKTVDRELQAELKRLGGKATVEVFAPEWLRRIVGDQDLAVFGRFVEIEVNERTDGHKAPVPKKLSDRANDDWLKILAGQDKLRRLELSGTAVTSAGLIHLKNLRNMERLNLCLTAVDDRGFAHLAGMTKMQRMVICASKITGSGFKHLQGMKQIVSINLHSAPASDDGLAAIGKLTSLRRLEIVHTHVTDKGLKHLAGLKNLEQLHVHGPETTANALPFLGELKELYQVDVYDKAASNQTLEQLGKLPKLRMLMLVIGTFDDAGVKHLAQSTSLQELSLDSPKMTEAALDHLTGLTNLRQLHVERTKVSQAARDRLKKALPKLVITP